MGIRESQRNDPSLKAAGHYLSKSRVERLSEDWEHCRQKHEGTGVWVCLSWPTLFELGLPLSGTQREEARRPQTTPLEIRAASRVRVNCLRNNSWSQETRESGMGLESEVLLYSRH